MILERREVMKNPEVESHTTIDEEDELLLIDELRNTGAWVLAMLHVALENPRNDEWLKAWKEKNEKSWRTLSK